MARPYVESHVLRLAIGPVLRRRLQERPEATRPSDSSGDGAEELGNSIEVSERRRWFNTDLSVTAFEAFHEEKNYWRMPPEVRERLYPYLKELSILHPRQNLSVTETERYHEAVEAAQAGHASLPFYETQGAGYPKDMEAIGSPGYLARQRALRERQAPEERPSRRPTPSP